jgi:two-component system, response regulator
LRVPADRPVRILVVDDDPDDQLLIREALAEARVQTDVQVVNDGLELLDYLRRGGRFSRVDAPQPDLILLDLNMPRMGGHEVLQNLKTDPQLRQIPIVVLTTSKREEDVRRSYDFGANTFISKPNSFPDLVEVVQALEKYWFRVAELP